MNKAKTLALVALGLLATGGGAAWWLTRTEPIPEVLEAVEDDPAVIEIPGLEGQPPLRLDALEGKTAFFVVIGTWSAKSPEGEATNRALSRWTFPEGVRGISKTYDKAYQLQEFGLGFMRLALETNTPIVPVGVVGAEEQMPALFNLEKLGALFGAPAFPITPTWPLLGPVGALPLPVKYRLYFGKPMTFEGQPDDEDRIVRAQVQEVKDAIDALLKQGLSERQGIFR